jgi:hypothetical protein
MSSVVPQIIMATNMLEVRTRIVTG